MNPDAEHEATTMNVLTWWLLRKREVRKLLTEGFLGSLATSSRSIVTSSIFTEMLFNSSM
jgi:fluoride ion exporter CrcB/FEX